MKKQVLFLIWLFLLNSFSILFAQNLIHKVMGTNDADKLTGIIEQPDGTLILVGFRSRFTPPFDDGLIVAIDTMGDTVWTRTLQTPLSDKINGISKGGNGEFFIVGQTAHPGGNFEEDPFVAKFDANGNRIWSKTYGDTTFQSEHFNDAVEDPGTGNLYMTGRMQAQILAVKTDANGNTKWARQYGIGEGYKLAMLPNGNLIIVGENGGTGRIIAIDTTGTPVWNKKFDTNFSMTIRDVIPNSDGILVVGVTNQPSSGDDAFLMQLDQNGNILWKKRYGNNATNQANELVQVDDTTVAIVGMYNQAGNQNGYSWIAEVNTAEEGDTLFNHFYQAKNGGVDLSIIEALMAGADPAYLLAGTEFSSSVGGNNFYLMETDTVFKRGGCPPSKVDRSDFVVDTFSVSVTDDTTVVAIEPDEMDADSSMGVDPEGILEISEDIKATINGQFTVNGMPGDSADMELISRTKELEEYQFHTTTKLKGEVFFSFTAPEEDNLIRGRGFLDDRPSIPTYNGNITRWEDGIPISIDGCEDKDIGTIDAFDASSFGSIMTDYTIKGTLSFDPSYPNPGSMLTFLDRYRPNGLLFVNLSTGSVPGASFGFGSTGSYQINNVPATQPGESYTLYADFPGLPLINPHTNITINNRFAAEPSYDFVIYEDFIEGVLRIDSTTSISTPVIRDFGLTIYPNPAFDQVRVNVFVPEQEAHLIIADFYGREVYSHPEALTQGQHQLTLPLNQLAAGIYSLRIEIPFYGRQVKKLVIH